jgi:uncharacterized membrane protein YkgB
MSQVLVSRLLLMEAPGRLLSSRVTPQGGMLMIQSSAPQSISKPTDDLGYSRQMPREARSTLTKLAGWISDRDIPFLVISVGMIVMLFWAGSYKMTAPGAEGIAPLVDHSPLIWWHFKLFGPYIGSDIIGATEWMAAILFLVGYVKPKAGIVGGFIATLMFFLTSTMFFSTPGTVISVPGIRYMRYMGMLGLFLFKDIIALGASFYLVSYYGKKAIVTENTR